MRILSLDERPRRMARDILAVRAAMAAWSALSLLILVLLVLPGADREHADVLLGCAGFGLAWSALLAVLPAKRQFVPLIQAGTVIAVWILPIAVAASGGSASPLRVLVLLPIVFCAWFYEPVPALSGIGAMTALHLLPLAYDPHAYEWPLLGYTITLAAAFVVTGGMMVAGRRELAYLRDTARADSLRDPLTELANRRRLMLTLENRAHGRRGEDRVGLLLLDLDGFKQVNTAHGHTAGDEALKVAARALRTAARDDDLVARLGGDEFAIVIRDADEAVLRTLGERAVTAVRAAAEHLELDGIVLGASAGGALLPDDAGTPDELLKAADARLRDVKRTGKGRCAVEPLAA